MIRVGYWSVNDYGLCTACQIPLNGHCKLNYAERIGPIKFYKSGLNK